MEKMLTEEQLNELDKSALITIILSIANQMAELTEMNKLLKLEVESLSEKLSLSNTRQFAPSSEAGLTGEQLSIYDIGFNEAEALTEGAEATEPELEEVVSYKRKKKKGKREEDLSGFPIEEIRHELSEEELEELFPDGYAKLPDEVYKKLEMVPSTFKVLEHHLSVYKGKDGKIVKVDHPKELFPNSIATPSIVAAIINAKYVNAMPLYRQEQEYKRNDVNISRQTMANWCIRSAERYLSLVSDKLKEELLKSQVVHADETPVTVKNDGRNGTHNSYMWVYRSGEMCKANPVIIYDYQKTRKAEAPRRMLDGYQGKLVCDGYQVYHGIENDKDDLTVAGCWAHARRPFAEIVKSLGKDKAKNTAAYEAVLQIEQIYRKDNELLKLSPKERKRKRRLLVKPLVNGFFDWCREEKEKVRSAGKTSEGINYCLNQEKYLRVFLSDPEVPLDNNPAERAIRPFCVGKKNWILIDTIHGAEASAILYSLTETAKANKLKPFNYIKHLLTEIPKHVDETDQSFLDELLPWSDALPDECRKSKTS
jgi:transposase